MTMPDSSNTMQEDAGFPWEPIPDENHSQGGDSPGPAFITGDGDDAPDADVLTPKKRSPKAVKYEEKTRGLFRFGFNVALQSNQVADAATIVDNAPEISEAMGDLAAENAKVARMVDFLTDTTDNAALALITASIPFALQIMRNHEDAVQVRPERVLRIPFIKREFRIRLKINLRGAKKFTEPPEQVTVRVFSDPFIQEALRKQGISVVIPD